MTQRFILGIDQGTTGSTALVIGPKGQVLGKYNQEFPQYFPRAGWVEHNPLEIWENVKFVMSQALQAAGVGYDRVAAIGITNQRETTVLWDRATGQPVHNAIVWQCRRTADKCQALREAGYEPLFRERTGLVLDPYFSGTKLAWLLEQSPETRRRAEAGELAFGTVETWLLSRLTGQHLTDFSNASRTLMFNIHTRQWDEELLGILGIPKAVLPEVRGLRSDFGRTMPTAFGGESVAVLATVGDQQAALAGHFGFSAGACKNTYGTGCFVVANMGQRNPGSAKGLLTTLAGDAQGQPVYALEGSIFMGGAIIQWLRDGLGIIGSAAETEALATSLADTGGVYLIPAFVGLGSPYWDSEARGAFLGLTRGSRREHLVRAALEAIAFQTRDVVDAMTREGGVSIPELAVDGGATANGFLMQFQADILGLPVVKRSINETTAYGAALFAGMEAGLFREEELRNSVTVERRYEPQMSTDERESRYAGWQQAVSKVLTK